MNERILRLLNKEEYHLLIHQKICIIGIGGVGGYALECLVRSGIKQITIIDYDQIEESNLNRQIISNRLNIGMNKVEAAKERALLINPNIQIEDKKIKLTIDNIDHEIKGFDYVLDCCDDTLVKCQLMIYCSQNKIKLFSSMGTANRIHPELLRVMKLKDTSGDPLAKKLRNLLKNNKCALNTTVLCSDEIPSHQRLLGTICSLPMTAGAILASLIITDIKKEAKASV